MSKTFIIAAGHGLRPDGSFDPGAINSKDKTREYDYNQAIRNRVIDYLHKDLPGVVIYSDQGLLGAGASDPNWKGVLKYADLTPRKWDLVLEIHHDYELAKPAGFGIYPRPNYIFNQDMSRLADSITANYRVLGLPTKPSYADIRGLGLVRGRKYPSLIWECSKIEAVSQAVLVMRAEGIARGIIDYFAPNSKHFVKVNGNKLVVNFKSNADKTTFYKALNLPLNTTGGKLDQAIIVYKLSKNLYPSAIVTPTVLARMGLTGEFTHSNA